ncbi:60S ribosome subunit bioproteinsis protein nip7 [Elsinoe australis]|uniref:60S ribosome subunit biogenesis protein NIP7 n=1 Tax=Elsinoe australis TaxID=40998 RepID=A0A2P7YG67_9PEZI|nr:60S ribosome subunit bioproteinsis protein nip7 [Elsinoe australis]
MRALTEPETQTLFKKLANYTGRSLNHLLTDTAPVPSTANKKRKQNEEGDRHVFRISHSRVYYVRESLAGLATSIARPNLLSLGTCLGKFTRTGQFRMHITALDVIAPHARYKVHVKANGEMPFLYGGHVLKAHVGRMSEEVPEHSGVVVCDLNDRPLGFGVTSKASSEVKRMEPTAIVVYRQADVGEYLREEDTLFAG